MYVRTYIYTYVNIYAYMYLHVYIVADLRPYHDENEAIPSLRPNSTQPGEDDGDHLTMSLETFPNDPNPDMRSSTVKEVQMVVRNLLNNSDSKLASSSSFWPGFVWLVESSTEG